MLQQFLLDIFLDANSPFRPISPRKIASNCPTFAVDPSTAPLPQTYHLSTKLVTIFPDISKVGIVTSHPRRRPPPQPGESCAAGMRGCLTWWRENGTTSFWLRYETRPFLSLPPPSSPRSATDAPPFFPHIEIRQRFAEWWTIGGRGEVQCTERSSTNSSFPPAGMRVRRGNINSL